MSRKLWLLDVVLLALVGAAGFQFHRSWEAARAREGATLRRGVKAVALPPLPPLQPEPPVTPATYVDVAQKMLFDPSRNPNVVIEKPPPPPPKPMPPLPLYHGMLNLGEGPIAILSINSSAPHQAIHPGEMIGPFKLVDANGEEVVLEWDGKEIHKRVDELKDHGQTGPGQAQQQQANARTETPQAPPAPVASQSPQQRTPQARSGPGEMTGFGFRTCNLNDGNAAGTVIDGFRKSINPTPFGNTCTWDPVK